MEKSVSDMKRLTANVAGVSAKIRILGAAGIPRAEIARFLGKRYQHVRNVLENEKIKAVKAAEAKESGDVLAAKVKLGPDGRVVIPAAMRAALGMKEDDVFFARIEDGEIRFATPHRTMQRVNDVLRPYVPNGVSLADELIAERKRDAEREKREAKGG